MDPALPFHSAYGNREGCRFRFALRVLLEFLQRVQQGSSRSNAGHSQRLRATSTDASGFGQVRSHGECRSCAVLVIPHFILATHD